MSVTRVKGGDVFWLTLKGVSFEPYASNLRAAYISSTTDDGLTIPASLKVRLVRDLTNQFDPFAVKVWFNEYQVGFIPRERTRELIEQGLSNVQATFSGFNSYNNQIVGASIRVEMPQPKRIAVNKDRQLKLIKKLTTSTRRILGD